MRIKFILLFAVACIPIVLHGQSHLRRRDNQKIEKRLEYMDYQCKFISILNNEYMGLVTNDVFSWQVIVDKGE